MAFTGTCTTEMCGVGNGLRAYGDLNCDGLRNQRRQSIRAGSVGAEGKDHRPAAERLRAQSRDAAYDVAYDSFLPQIGLGWLACRNAPAFVIDRQGVIQYAEMPRRRARAAQFR